MRRRLSSMVMPAGSRFDHGDRIARRSPLSASATCPLLFYRMQLVDYLNGMWYMICLPEACFVDPGRRVEDVRAPCSPAHGLPWAAWRESSYHLRAIRQCAVPRTLQSSLFAVLAAVTAVRTFRLIRPGALGFGRLVGSTSVMGLGVKHVRLVRHENCCGGCSWPSSACVDLDPFRPAGHAICRQNAVRPGNRRGGRGDQYHCASAAT